MDPSNGSTEGDGMSTALCDLLVKLPIWDDLADRKDFVKSAFRGKHPALAGLIWENAECAVAGNLAPLPGTPGTEIAVEAFVEAGR